MTDIAATRGAAPRVAARTVTTAALLAALLAASSLLAVRIGPVPLTLQVTSPVNFDSGDCGWTGFPIRFQRRSSLSGCQDRQGQGPRVLR